MQIFRLLFVSALSRPDQPVCFWLTKHFSSAAAELELGLIDCANVTSNHHPLLWWWRSDRPRRLKNLDEISITSSHDTHKSGFDPRGSKRSGSRGRERKRCPGFDRAWFIDSPRNDPIFTSATRALDALDCGRSITRLGSSSSETGCKTAETRRRNPWKSLLIQCNGN